MLKKKQQHIDNNKELNEKAQQQGIENIKKTRKERKEYIKDKCIEHLEEEFEGNELEEKKNEVIE